MVVGETSDSFSMLLQGVSRGSVGSRCAPGSETAAETGFAKDCPSQTRMFLEQRHGTRPTSRPQQHAPRGLRGSIQRAQRRASVPLWRARGDAMRCDGGMS